MLCKTVNHTGVPVLPLACCQQSCRCLTRVQSRDSGQAVDCCVALPQINAAVGCLARLPLPSPGDGGLVHRRHRGFASAPAPGPPPSPGWRGRGAATANRLREAWNPYLRHALSAFSSDFAAGASPPKPLVSIRGVVAFRKIWTRRLASALGFRSCLQHTIMICQLHFGCGLQGDSVAAVCICGGVCSDRAIQTTSARLHSRIRAPRPRSVRAIYGCVVRTPSPASKELSSMNARDQQLAASSP